MSDVRNVIIIGSGPAGYTAGLYAARAMLEPLMFGGYLTGGQLMLTSDIENFPGYPQGIGGPEMMIQLREQAERFGLEVQDRNVESVDLSQRPYKVTVEGEEFLAHSIIISTGAESIWLNAEGEAEQKGRGISTCATCDGAFFRDEEVLVIGGGDSACEEASYLANICTKVTMLVRKDHFRASKAMQNRLANFDNINVLFNHEIDEVIGENVVEGIKIKNNLNNEVSEIKITGLFIAIGHSPNTDIFKGSVEMDDSGYILTNKISTKTNIPGVFAAGDVQDKDYRQAITAAGTGCMAALDAERYLQEV